MRNAFNIHTEIAQYLLVLCFCTQAHHENKLRNIGISKIELHIYKTKCKPAFYKEVTF